MSTSVTEMDKLAVQQTQVDLVAEKMNRIAVVLEGRYGIRAIPLVDSANDECQLVLQQTGQPIGIIYYYDVENMLEVDAEVEAARLAEFLATRATESRKG